jgi:hypothetical protein
MRKTYQLDLSNASSSVFFIVEVIGLCHFEKNISEKTNGLNNCSCDDIETYHMLL